MPPSAMIGRVRAGRRARGLGDRGDLGHARPGDDPGRADRARPHADLHRAHPRRDEVRRALVGAHVAGDHLEVGVRGLHLLHDVADALAVAVGGVHHQHVHLRLDEGGHALEGVRGDTHRRPDPEAAERVLAGVRVLDLLLDVLDGDEALEVEVAVHDEELLHLVLVEDLPGLLEGGAHGDRDQVVLGHELRDGEGRARLEAQVAVGEDADELRAHRDGHAADAELRHEGEGLRHRRVRRHGHGVHDHARLGPLHLVHLGRLGLDGHVLVDEAEPALLGEGDREVGLGDGVHGRGDDRDPQRDRLRQARR